MVRFFPRCAGPHRPPLPRPGETPLHAYPPQAQLSAAGRCPRVVHPAAGRGAAGHQPALLLRAHGRLAGPFWRGPRQPAHRPARHHRSPVHGRGTHAGAAGRAALPARRHSPGRRGELGGDGVGAGGGGRDHPQRARPARRLQLRLLEHGPRLLQRHQLAPPQLSVHPVRKHARGLGGRGAGPVLLQLRRAQRPVRHGAHQRVVHAQGGAHRSAPEPAHRARAELLVVGGDHGGRNALYLRGPGLHHGDRRDPRQPLRIHRREPARVHLRLAPDGDPGARRRRDPPSLLHVHRPAPAYHQRRPVHGGPRGQRLRPADHGLRSPPRPGDGGPAAGFHHVGGAHHPLHPRRHPARRRAERRGCAPGTAAGAGRGAHAGGHGAAPLRVRPRLLRRQPASAEERVRAGCGGRLAAAVELRVRPAELSRPGLVRAGPRRLLERQGGQLHPGAGRGGQVHAAGAGGADGRPSRRGP
jgi:hypothetical protein